MRALVLDGTGFDHLQIRKVPVPLPGPRQMLARVDAAGICTSNIKLVEQGPNHSLLYGWDLTRYPLILGDEAERIQGFGITRFDLEGTLVVLLRNVQPPESYSRRSHTEMGLIMGSWPLTYIMVAAVAGAIIDKWGTRKSLLVGIVIIGLSAVLRYFANGFATMLLAVALFGVGGPMISIGCPKTISVWFKGSVIKSVAPSLSRENISSGLHFSATSKIGSTENFFRTD